MKLWIARNRNNSLFGYEQEPVRNRENGRFDLPNGACKHYYLDENLFPEITWETNPIRVEIKYKKFGRVMYSKKQIEQALYWQRKYDELNADCKDLLSAVVNLVKGGENTSEPSFVQFNDEFGYPSATLDVIRGNALWDFRKKWIEANKPNPDDKKKIELEKVISDVEFYASTDKGFHTQALWANILRKLNVLRYDLDK